MDKETTEIIEEDGYVAVKWSEYKELLITKGKYEELSNRERTITFNPPTIQPLTVPYSQDLTQKYSSVTAYNAGRDKNGVLKMEVE